MNRPPRDHVGATQEKWRKVYLEDVCEAFDVLCEAVKGDPLNAEPLANCLKQVAQGNMTKPEAHDEIGKLL